MICVDASEVPEGYLIESLTQNHPSVRSSQCPLCHQEIWKRLVLQSDVWYVKHNPKCGLQKCTTFLNCNWKSGKNVVVVLIEGHKEEYAEIQKKKKEISKKVK
jgi:hypothetical protein